MCVNIIEQLRLDVVNQLSYKPFLEKWLEFLLLLLLIIYFCVNDNEKCYFQPLLSGQVERNYKSCSYVPQEAWIR